MPAITNIYTHVNATMVGAVVVPGVGADIAQMASSVRSGGQL